MAQQMDTPVLIVGGGPIGMSLAHVLARWGVEHTIVERLYSRSDHPKARGCWSRTMENYRVWGIEDEVRAGGLPGSADGMWACETVVGHVYGVGQPEPRTHNTPSGKSIVAQDVVETALAGLLNGNNCTDFLRGTEFVDYEEIEGGALARVRDLESNEVHSITCRYLIGTDGAGSRLRKMAGIVMEGPETMAYLANYFYRADVSHLPHVRLSAGFNLISSNPELPKFSSILATGPDATRWLWVARREDADEPTLSEEELTRVTRLQWGIPDLEVELLSVMNWRMSAQVPDKFQSGRVLLAGDAAHRFPPTGGMGMNSGTQDAQNLGWKLALVLTDRAPDSLLDTYEVERRPVAISNTKFAVGNYDRVARIEAAFDNREADPKGWEDVQIDLENHYHSSGQAMGFVYERGAVVDDGTPIRENNPRYYFPTDRPGARFPHMWLDAENTQTTIDWFDTSFVLVCGTDADEWLRAGEAVAAATDVPLVVRRLPLMAGPFTFGPTGAVLVRPDGHVAWRPDRTAPVSQSALSSALTFVVAGGTEAHSPVVAGG